jgi:hypothetical protein
VGLLELQCSAGALLRDSSELINKYTNKHFAPESNNNIPVRLARGGSGAASEARTERSC